SAAMNAVPTRIGRGVHQLDRASEPVHLRSIASSGRSLTNHLSTVGVGRPRAHRLTSPGWPAWLPNLGESSQSVIVEPLAPSMPAGGVHAGRREERRIPPQEIFCTAATFAGRGRRRRLLGRPVRRSPQSLHGTSFRTFGGTGTGPNRRTIWPTRLTSKVLAGQTRPIRPRTLGAGRAGRRRRSPAR